MLPSWSQELLPAGQASLAVNLYAFSGNMEGWRQPKLLRNLLNSAAKFAFRVPNTAQSPAAAYLLFTGNPAPGDTFIVGEITYTFQAAVVLPNDILIGATATATANNALAAITTDYGQQTNEGVLYGSNTAANAVVGLTGALTTSSVSFAPLGPGVGSAAYIPVVNILAPVVGAALNSMNVSENSTALLFLYDTQSLTHTTTTMQGGANPILNNGITAPSSWLEFLDPDTSVIRSQVLNDAYGRFYFASPSQQPAYNTTARIQAGQAPFLLGLNPPLVAPEVAPLGGGNNLFGPPGSVGGGAGYTTFAANTAVLVPFIPSAAMTLNDILFMPAGTDAAVQFAAVLYADAGNTTGPSTVPGALLSVGTIVTGIVSGTLAVSQFSNAALVAETPVWLGIMLGSNENIQNAASGTSTSYEFPAVFTNGPPGFAPNGTPNSRDLQIYGAFQSDSILEARAYAYTWATKYQEESAPSPFTIATGWNNGEWVVGLTQPPAADMGTLRNIAFVNIYRTVTGVSGSTAYFFVAQLPITQTAYIDNFSDVTIANNIQMPSTTYFPPPPNLQGMVNMPNGLTAGFIGNQIWICNPFLPHAWPPENVFTTDYPIVGLGFTAGALVACTEANPFVLSGSNPSVMSITKCQMPDPCLSRGSILSTDIGVYYASPNGLIQVTNLSQATNVTELWITREKWASLTPQKNGRAVPISGCYFSYGTTNGADVSVAQQGFAIQLDQDNTSFTIWPQPGGHRVGFTQLTAPNGFNVDNMTIDPWTGIALVIQNGATYYFDFTDPAPVMIPYTYTSKIYQQNNRKNFSAMRVFYTVPVNSPTQNAEPNQAPTNDPSWQTLGPNQLGVVLVYAKFVGNSDFVLVTAREIWQNGGLLRIAAGFKVEEWKFMFVARVVISNAKIATSIKELANV